MTIPAIMNHDRQMVYAQQRCWIMLNNVSSRLLIGGNRQVIGTFYSNRSRKCCSPRTIEPMTFEFFSTSGLAASSSPFIFKFLDTPPPDSPPTHERVRTPQATLRLPVKKFSYYHYVIVDDQPTKIFLQRRHICSGDSAGVVAAINAPLH